MSMTRPLHSLPVLALLALAACGGAGRDLPAPAGIADSPEVAECRQEARDNPMVRDFTRRMIVGNQPQIDAVRAEQRQVEQRVFSDCLRRRGLSRGGGVEAVRPRGAI
jgi:hypothetical protein